MSGTLLVRADAGPGIGAGHVMRCLALAQAWRAAAGSVVLASSEVGSSLAGRWTDEGMEVVLLDVARFSASDAEATVRLADQHRACAVVLDGYGFDRSFQARVRAPGRVVMVLDDNLENAPFEADCILNQNLHARALDYAARPPHATTLLGTDYALLRREFVQATPRRPSAQLRRILVTLGGADVAGATEAIVRGLLTLAWRGAIDVVLGPSAAALSLDDPRVQLHRDVRDMVPRMQAADLCVAAAGSTAWELARIGVPMVLGVSAENQRGVARSLQAAGVADVVELGTPASVAQIVGKVGQLVEHPSQLITMAERGTTMVDGRGSARVASVLQSVPHRIIELPCAKVDSCR